MTTHEDDASTRPEDPAARAEVDGIRWWSPYNAQVVTDRAGVQVDLIVSAFEREGMRIGVHHDEDGMVDYLCREATILTRDVDAPRVYRALGIDGPVEKGDERTPLQPSGLHVIPIEADRDVFSVLTELDARLGVGVAVPDHVLHVCPKTLVTWCAATEPAPESVDADLVRSTDGEADGRLTRVIVVDTGSRQDVIDAHSWLEGVTGEPEPPSVGHYTGHGTFVAGVVRTYAPRAEVRIESALPIGGAVFESDLVRQLGDALEQVPDVINISAGTRTRRGLPLLSMQVFWEERLRHLKGTVMVAAAGNDSDRGPFWPAAFPWVVSVGALDEAGEFRAGFSNHGSWVDVYALGTEVVNAYPTGTYEYRETPLVGTSADFPEGTARWSGTSFASPMVAGLIAARMTWSGESARTAAESLLQIARGNAGPGVGAVLDAGSAARP